jgi:hypothetical protein
VSDAVIDALRESEFIIRVKQLELKDIVKLTDSCIQRFLFSPNVSLYYLNADRTKLK